MAVVRRGEYKLSLRLNSLLSGKRNSIYIATCQLTRAPNGPTKICTISMEQYLLPGLHSVDIVDFYAYEGYTQYDDLVVNESLTYWGMTKIR